MALSPSQITQATNCCELSVVVPIYNEYESIPLLIEKITEAAQSLEVSYELICIDDGSSDGSAELLKTLAQARDDLQVILLRRNYGQTPAMAAGFNYARGQVIVTLDGDLQNEPADIATVYRKLEEGYDYVQGSRYLPGGVAENTPLERTIANRGIHAPLLSLAGRNWFTDTTNGFRAYSARYLLDPRVQPFRDVFQRYELLFYLTVRAGQIGMRVAQIPVQRRYPADAATPTKITGIAGKLDVLRQTWAAATGRFKPKD